MIGDMQFLMQTDEEIALSLAIQAKTLRINNNMTQKEFAEKSGVAYATYSQFERSGKISLRGFLSVLRHLGRLKSMASILEIGDIERVGIEKFVEFTNKKNKHRVKKTKS
ncbi:MAG: helix-turn-helix transcriptional regulator [Campylobacterota bacterium]|nr:helix-turn-helix transcriptional regulator [Campylobacterota bacterium]